MYWFAGYTILFWLLLLLEFWLNMDAFLSRSLLFFMLETEGFRGCIVRTFWSTARSFCDITFDKRLGLVSSSSPRPRACLTDIDLLDRSPPLLFGELAVFLKVILSGGSDLLLFATERRPLLLLAAVVKLGPPFC